MCNEFNIIKLSKKDYNALRSFVESSLKLKYDFNLPKLALSNKEFMFQKRKNNRIMWELEVGDYYSKLYLYDVIILYEESRKLITVASKNVDKKPVEINLCSQFETDENVAFKYAISVRDVINKMKLYMEYSKNIKLNILDFSS